MKRKIYLASSWKNELQPNAVKILRKAGHEVYDFRNPATGQNGFSWSNIDTKWHEWTAVQFIYGLMHPVAQNGYQLDKKALDWADTCVVLLPCGKSAHLEAGYSIGNGKETFFVMHEPFIEAELMYLLGGANNVYPDLQSLLPRLSLIPDKRTI